MANPVRSWRFRLLASASVAMSCPAFAEETTSDKGGLPQLDTSLFPEQLFWLAVSFAVLYVLMSVVALPRVARTQSNRKDLIASELEAARQASEKAGATIAALEQSLAEARSRAQANVSEIMANVLKDSAARQASQEHDLSRKLRWAEEEISVEHQAALEKVRKNSDELASIIVDKVIGLKVRSST